VSELDTLTGNLKRVLIIMRFKWIIPDVLVIALCLPFIGLAQPLSVPLSSYSKGNYLLSVFQSDMGGGGYITGIVQDPHNSDLLYARSDVAGVFKSVNGGKSWRVINSGLDKMSDHYCHSLAINPFNSKMLLRASGDVRSFKFTGRIHRSVDGGNSWKLVKDKLDYYGNGPIRNYGELIAFNPSKKGEVVAGSFSNGVWLSRNNGTSWKYAGLKGERIACVTYCDNRIYVGTVADSYVSSNSSDPKVIESLLKRVQDFSRGKDKGRIYMSSNGGKTWEVVFEKEHIAIFEMVVLDAGKTIIYVSNPGIYRSTDSGKTFDAIKGLRSDAGYRTIVQGSSDANVLFTAEAGTEVADIPIFRSDDKGATWKLISPDPKPENLCCFPTWHGLNTKRIGARISHILQDYKQPDKLYVSNWWGVTITEDMGKTYNGNYFEGIGILCMENLSKHPSKPGVIVAGVCDHAPALSTNGGATFHSLPINIWPPARLVRFSAHNPDLLLFVSQTKGRSISLYKSEDAGKTARVVWTLKGTNYIQDIKEDPFNKGRFYAFVEGNENSENTPGIYISNDYGETWSSFGTSPFAHLASVPADVYKIERNLTPIVNFQHKNGSGTGQLLTLDYFKVNVMYVGEWTSGIFRTTDYGKSWTNVGNKLPFDKDKNKVLQFVYAHPYEEGVVYAGFWNAGLWKSDDFGDSWKQVSPLYPANASSLSIHKNKEGKTLMALACSNHPLGESKTTLWISEDNGGTWTDIYDFSLGCARFIAVEVDADLQRIYTATAGNGVICFDYKRK
jgi:hypothetical protein